MKRDFPAPGESSGCVKVVRDVVACAAGLLLIAAVLVACGWAGWLQDWFHAAYIGP